MIGGDSTQAIALLGFAASPDAAREALLYALAAVMGGCSTLSGVALRSSVPEIVGPGPPGAGQRAPRDRPFARHGVRVRLRRCGGRLGGVPAAFVLDAGTFLVSAATLALLPLAAPARRKPNGTRTPEPRTVKSAPRAAGSPPGCG